MRILFEGWDPVDRQPVRGTLEGLDRAQTQAADLVTVQLSAASPAPAGEMPAAAAAGATAAAGEQQRKAADGAQQQEAAASLTVTIKQNPVALRPGNTAGRIGACAWDGAFVLAAYLEARQPPGGFAGLRAVELGAGMGLPGLVLARLQADVYLTDRPSAVVFGRVNAGRNRLLAAQQQQQQQAEQEPQQAQQQQQQGPGPGSVEVLALDWEDAAGTAAAVAAITAGGLIDLILGTDCIYPDPDGSVPSASGLLAAICALATPGRTRALLTFEARAQAEALRAALLGAAAAASAACRVERVPPEALPAAYRAPHIELYELTF